MILSGWLVFAFTEEGNIVDAREMMKKAVRRAAGYADDEKLYQVHLYYAQQLGALAGFTSDEVLELVRKELHAHGTVLCMQ